MASEYNNSENIAPAPAFSVGNGNGMAPTEPEQVQVQVGEVIPAPDSGRMQAQIRHYYQNGGADQDGRPSYSQGQGQSNGNGTATAQRVQPQTQNQGFPANGNGNGRGRLNPGQVQNNNNIVKAHTEFSTLPGNTHPTTNFVFSNGFTLEIQPVDTDLYSDVRRSHKMPKPPLNEVPSPNGGTRWVENEHDTYYKELLELYQAEVMLDFLDQVIWYGTVLELDDNQLLQVISKRDEASKRKLELDPDDKMVFIKKVLCRGPQGQKDLKELISAIQKLNNPTEEEIDQKVSSFRR